MQHAALLSYAQQLSADCLATHVDKCSGWGGEWDWAVACGYECWCVTSVCVCV